MLRWQCCLKLCCLATPCPSPLLGPGCGARQASSSHNQSYFAYVSDCICQSQVKQNKYYWDGNAVYVLPPLAHPPYWVLGAAYAAKSRASTDCGAEQRARIHYESTDPHTEQWAPEHLTRIHIQPLFSRSEPDHLMAACFSISLLRYEWYPTKDPEAGNSRNAHNELMKQTNKQYAVEVPRKISIHCHELRSTLQM